MPRQPIKGLHKGPWREGEHLRKARGSGRNQLGHGDNHGIRSPRGVSVSPPWRAASKVRLRNSGSSSHTWQRAPCVRQPSGSWTASRAPLAQLSLAFVGLGPAGGFRVDRFQVGAFDYLLRASLLADFVEQS